MDPDGLGADMAGLGKGLGPNPFAGGGGKGLPPDLAGLLGKGKKR
jgi:hypothetical protein